MSETKPYRVVRNPEPSCIFHDVVDTNGNRVNFRALHLDEAEHQATALNSAFAQGFAAAATGEGEKRLREVARKFIDDVDALCERSNREKRVLGAQRCTIILIDDACEGIEAIRSALNPRERGGGK